MKTLRITIYIISAISLFSCKTEEIILHGDILGFVTDASTNIPVQDASIKLNPGNDSTGTLNDGSFKFRNLTPGQYEIEASKNSYAGSKENIVVAEGETQQIDFSLNGVPAPTASVNFLDFGLDSTTLRFTISNTGKGNFAFILTPNQDWITVSPSNGSIGNDTVNLIVTINKTGLMEMIYKESIKLISFAGQVPLPDLMIPVYLNGVSDNDGNYYKVIRIGPQIWMAENINVGSMINIDENSGNNVIIEKYCYNNNPQNCKTYGGLYQWDEMMEYQSDDGITGTKQGICHDGWHIPNARDWYDLVTYLGGSIAEKLKEAGYAHWLSPNTASNESGFTALPGGHSDPESASYGNLGVQGNWWSDDLSVSTGEPFSFYLNNNLDISQYFAFKKSFGYSVRCIKNP
jgi:uncharacterized protein (TIGR02145 family)